MTPVLVVGGVLLAFALLVGALVWSARQRGQQSAEAAGLQRVSDAAKERVHVEEANARLSDDALRRRLLDGG